MLPRRVSIDEVPLLLSADIPALGSYPWYFYFSWLGPTSFFLLFFFLGWVLDFVLFCCWCHVLVFPFSHACCCLVFLCLLPMAALLDSWLSYCRVCVCRVHIVFRVCLTDPFSLLWRNSLSCPYLMLWRLGGASVCIPPPRG